MVINSVASNLCVEKHFRVEKLRRQSFVGCIQKISLQSAVKTVENTERTEKLFDFQIIFGKFCMKTSEHYSAIALIKITKYSSNIIPCKLGCRRAQLGTTAATMLNGLSMLTRAFMKRNAFIYYRINNLDY